MKGENPDHRYKSYLRIKANCHFLAEGWMKKEPQTLNKSTAQCVCSGFCIRVMESKHTVLSLFSTEGMPGATGEGLDGTCSPLAACAPGECPIVI